MDRRALAGVASAVLNSSATPDVTVDVFRDIAAERTKLISSVQTSHTTDKAIGSLVARDVASVASLEKWAKRGTPVLRVNSIGILAKVGSPVLDNGIVRALRADEEARRLYLSAVASRVLRLPWEEAKNLIGRTAPLDNQDQVKALADEMGNQYDSGARWCALILLARTRAYDSTLIDPALHSALKNEPSPEMLRTIGGVLAGLDPVHIRS